jgi:hypothetical protein
LSFFASSSFAAVAVAAAAACVGEVIGQSNV